MGTLVFLPRRTKPVAPPVAAAVALEAKAMEQFKSALQGITASVLDHGTPAMKAKYAAMLVEHATIVNVALRGQR